MKISYDVEKLLGRLRKAWLVFLGRKGWTWGGLIGVHFDLNACDLVQGRREAFGKQRTDTKTQLGLF